MTRDVFAYATEKRVSGAFLSLDQAKAFDRSSVVVNGSTTDTFEYTRGIRQGCPLGPTLFVLSIEPVLTSLACDPNIRGLPLEGVEELKVLAYAHDISLFLRDARSLEFFRRAFASYAEASGATLNEEKSKALLSALSPASAIGNFKIVTTVKGVAATTWSRAVDRASLLAERAKLLDLSLREKAVAVKTSLYALAAYVSRVAVMPFEDGKRAEQADQRFSIEQQTTPRQAKPPPTGSDRGGLGLPMLKPWAEHAITSDATCSSIGAAPDKTGWAWIDHTGPFAESPAPFYKTASATSRMLRTERPAGDVDADPPSRILEDLTRLQLNEDEKRRAKRAKRRGS
ncbi:hypothetical protein HPB52_009284 [Rhipicephalus sanguineus]|uniref:Reverse transcriptase domain-containing protein n=1 Tax=Rhipicephalus sanguineus TaxID=34632 RepID=A0A9D4PYX0_RHISA|nr:hypothetical protein HPB52_009284 [Rhipicephalus sanguineus]